MNPSERDQLRLMAQNYYRWDTRAELAQAVLRLLEELERAEAANADLEVEITRLETKLEQVNEDPSR